MTLEQMKGAMAQDGEVFRRVIQADSGSLFSQGQVEGPMKGIFDSPLGSGRLEHAFGMRR